MTPSTGADVVTVTIPAACEHTWPAGDPREETYPQHRCGNVAGHDGPCVCRYRDRAEWSGGRRTR